ncbi:MAG: TRAP transporter small permease [Hydrogenophaga sp.]|nr:TRAP transporter small permease [Hydrogenophaga sp.]
MLAFTRFYFRALEVVMVLCLAAMCVMVFGNVVLRHVFDSGINTSEELSRFAFIWLTFLGAVVVARENGHLGVDMLVIRLTPRTRRAALITSRLFTSACCVVFLWGLLRQHGINVANTALITGIPMAVAYAAAYVCAASLALMALVEAWWLWRRADANDPEASPWSS